MSASRFAALCSKYLIDPATALENKQVRQALKDRNDREVERLLREEF